MTAEMLRVVHLSKHDQMQCAICTLLRASLLIRRGLGLMQVAEIQMNDRAMDLYRGAEGMQADALELLPDHLDLVAEAQYQGEKELCSRF